MADGDAPRRLMISFLQFVKPLFLGGPQRPKIHQCGISRIRLTLKSSLCTFLSAVVAADWLQLDGGMET